MARPKTIAVTRTLNAWDNLASSLGLDAHSRLAADPRPDALAGTSGPDVLVGTSGPDTLQGLGGNDILVGLAGTDTLEGGTGDDIFYIEDSTDILVELTGEGFDTAYVYAAMTYVLAAGVSVEWLAAYRETDTLAINLTGNELVNYVVGNDGANILDGGGGADFLIGNGGDDTYRVNLQSDWIVEKAGDGFDTVIASSGTFNLAPGSSIERLEFAAGTSGGILRGNELSQTIVGNDGGNQIYGMGGGDTLQGLGGNDFYGVVNAADVIIEVAGGGNDSVLVSTSYVLGADASVEYLAISPTTGTGAIDLTGSSTDNYLVGNNGDNILDAKGGQDILRGNGGADTFAFTTAGADGNWDYVQDFGNGADKIGLSAAIFDGIGTVGAFNADALRMGFDPLDADDRIMYTTYGEIFYDADGNGAGAPVLIALLGIGHPATLAASDFVVI